MPVPPVPLPPSAGPRVPSSGLTTADGRPIELSTEQSTGRNLLDILKPGDVLSGRVVELFADNNYLFTIRGRNLIAQSSIPLLRDSVVQFQVMDTSDGIHIKLANGTNNPQAIAAQPSFLERLGIADSSQARQVLSAFQNQQAPIDSATRIEQAVRAVSQATPQQAPIVAAAHALLAKVHLPVTPVLLQTATHALTNGLPNPSQHLQQAATVLQQAVATQTPTTTTPSPQVATASTPQTTAPLTNNSTLSPTQQNTAVPIQNQTVSPSGPALTAGGLSPQPPNISSALETVTSLLQRIPDPLAHAPANATLTDVQSSATNSAPESIAAAHPSEAAHKNPATFLPLEQSLSQDLSELSHQLRALPNTPETQHMQHALVREFFSELIFKPSGFEDYDLVVPFHLSLQKQAVPARLAVANRSTSGGGTATFVRVDVELDTLGPVSIRLNSASGSPVAITLLATEPALSRIQAGLDALQEDLDTAQVSAHVRVADISSET